ncbi:hypothetical protein BpHYR1_050804 [Brachionus plicatilis]|uniref:Uncharacterized protein n=1 Tax=Brachionus plicatilis TaxID=10195 RepID=A0A3M7T7Z1_BRAPC|nr:hypothetical protein BpHYR1_050804 [Brachionus plicatilis]
MLHRSLLKRNKLENFAIEIWLLICSRTAILPQNQSAVDARMNRILIISSRFLHNYFKLGTFFMILELLLSFLLVVVHTISFPDSLNIVLIELLSHQFNLNFMEGKIVKWTDRVKTLLATLAVK